MFGQASHVALTFIFGGIPLLLVWAFYWKLILKDWKILLITSVFAIFLAYFADSYTIRHNVWNFSPDKILGIWINGAPLDDYVFGIVSALLISSATLMVMSWQDLGKLGGARG